MKAAALDFAALGWRVFPVAADGRSPLIKGGCHSATSDAGQVEHWWSRWPHANVALACGPDTGVLALDIDRKADADGFAKVAELEREFAQLPATVRSRTPSGGAHLLFAYPAGAHPANRVGIKRYGPNGDRTVYAGLDVRGRGASICLPPSQKGTGVYAWEQAPWAADLAPLPAWLLALMLSEPPPRQSEPLRIQAADRLARYVCRAIEGECGAVAQTPAGSGRNQRLFIAAARLGSLVGASALVAMAEAALEQAAADCGLVSDDGLRAVRLTIASGMKRGTSNPRELAT